MVRTFAFCMFSRTDAAAGNPSEHEKRPNGLTHASPAPLSKLHTSAQTNIH